MAETGFDFKKWYESHGKQLNKKRRGRYKSDPDYRARVLQANRDARARRRMKQQEERKQVRDAMEVPVGSPPWRVVEVELREGGARNELFTIGAVARMLQCSVQAIRLWERQGMFPPPSDRSDKGDRLYTADDILVIHKVMEAQGKLKGGRVRPTGGPVDRKEQGFEYEVKFKTGGRRIVRLFRIGLLARRLGRTVLTVEQMENRGVLPSTPFRVSNTGYRLYTEEMLEAAKRSMDARGGMIRGDEGWKDFHDEVLHAWTNLGVMGAKVIGRATGSPSQ